MHSDPATTGNAGSMPPNGTRALVITGATVVDTRDGHLTPQSAIVIEGGTITRVAPAASVEVGEGVQTVDARGQFVVPGFLEMHAHPLNSPDAASSLRVMLAQGITGFRQMAGSPELLEARRAGQALSLPDAPELLTLPGAILLPPVTASVEGTVAEIRHQKAMGADFIKFVEGSPPVLFAALEEATAQGLPLAGHVPVAADALEVSKAGMRCVEHLGASLSQAVLLSCSTEEERLRRAMLDMPRGRPPLPSGGDLAALQRAVANPLAAAPPATFDRVRRTLDSYDRGKAEHLATTFAANQTWQAPTLIRNRTMQFGDAPLYREDPNLRYVPPATRSTWDEIAGTFSSNVADDARDTLRRVFEAQLELVKLFDDSGVPMLAGSDFGGQWLVAGFSLHQEFDLLAEAGLSPLTILQMTTLNGARFLGREASLGSVAEGKDANLVLLGADPTASAQNLHAIEGVVRAGTYYSAAALHDLEAAVSAGLAT